MIQYVRDMCKKKKKSATPSNCPLAKEILTE